MRSFRPPHFAAQASLASAATAADAWPSDDEG